MRISFRLLASLGAFAASVSANASEPPTPPSVDDAPIAYLLDLTSGQVLFEREADRRFMPASITKVMTTFLAFEWMKAGKIVPQQVVTLQPALWQEWKNVGSTMFLAADARVTVDDLVHGVTTVSANDGAAALANGAAGSVDAWVAAMNAKAREIGMANSHFGTPNGWMDEGNTFVTARDLSTLASAMIRLHPAKYHHFVGQREFTYNGIKQSNHDPITGVVPGADGIKTGFTNQAGYGFLGSAQRNGRRLVMVIAASPRAGARARASRDLIEWGFAAFDQRRLVAPGGKVGAAAVQEGSVSEIGLIAPRGVFVDLPKGKQPDVKLTLRYEGPLKAPIAKGEEVAFLHVAIDGMPDFEVPLQAAEAVETANFAERALNGLRSWLP